MQQVWQKDRRMEWGKHIQKALDETLMLKKFVVHHLNDYYQNISSYFILLILLLNRFQPDYRQQEQRDREVF